MSAMPTMQEIAEYETAAKAHIERSGEWEMRLMLPTTILRLCAAARRGVEASAQPVSDERIEQIQKNMRLAWHLGQTYFQQADSESYAQNRRSDETRQKFDKLLADTASLLREAQQAAPKGTK